MKEYLQGSTNQLIGRGQTLLSKIPANLPREFYALAQVSRDRLSALLDQLEQVARDPDMQAEDLQPEWLRLIRRTVRGLDLLETVAITTLNRANDDDRRMNRLVERIKNEISYPLLPPATTLLSQNYYHIIPQLNLLCLPIGEVDSFLHLPDLYHELGHTLIAEKHDLRVRPFQNKLGIAFDKVLEYLTDELQKEDRRHGPADFRFYLQLWVNSWAQSWAVEFFCDLFAIYTVGPAFAWANVHLCAKHGGDPYAVPLVAPSSHPADDARMRTMLIGLGLIGFEDVAENIRLSWQDLMDISGAKSEPEYLRCFPQHVLENLASNALEGIHAIGCNIAGPNTTSPVYTVLNEAWLEFWRNPGDYVIWERKSIGRLREFSSSYS